MLFAGLGQALVSTGLGVVAALLLFVAQGVFAARLGSLTASVQRAATEIAATLGTAIRRAYSA